MSQGAGTELGRLISLGYPVCRGAGTKPLTQMQLPLPPGESMKHFVHPVQFELKLFASDPQIKRPICMNWDEQGRLWIAETLDYPHNIQPSGSGKGNDRLVICEDTKGTGRMDKFTVFADKLSIPAGFTFSKGGVMVFEGQKTVLLKDTSGDGKATDRQELFGTWAQGDTHGGEATEEHLHDHRAGARIEISEDQSRHGGVSLWLPRSLLERSAARNAARS